MRTIAGWSSPVARQAHNLKVGGSNPLPASALVVVRSLRLLEESFLDVAQVDGGAGVVLSWFPLVGLFLSDKSYLVVWGTSADEKRYQQHVLSLEFLLRRLTMGLLQVDLPQETKVTKLRVTPNK